LIKALGNETDGIRIHAIVINAMVQTMLGNTRFGSYF